MYDNQNVFAKILRGEIPSKKIYENEFALAFHDANPMFEKHALIIPKGEYENVLDFLQKASTEEQLGFWNCFEKTTEIMGIKANFNISSNAGEVAPYAKQIIFHFHIHLVAGQRNPNIPKPTAIL